MKTDIPIEHKSGVYKIKCPECNRYYIGQTGRNFIDRYKEHLPCNKTNITKSNYARHLAENKHGPGDFKSSVESIKKRKGRLMNTKFEIYRAFKNDPENILNDQLSFQSHCLYYTALNN